MSEIIYRKEACRSFDFFCKSVTPSYLYVQKGVVCATIQNIASVISWHVVTGNELPHTFPGCYVSSCLLKAHLAKGKMEGW